MNSVSIRNIIVKETISIVSRLAGKMDGKQTRNKSRTTIDEQPNPASHGLILERFVKNPVQISTNEDPLNFNPKRPFTCVEATVNAAAEQKPEITGADINSTRNPIKNPRELIISFCLFPFSVLFQCRRHVSPI